MTLHAKAAALAAGRDAGVAAHRRGQAGVRSDYGGWLREESGVLDRCPNPKITCDLIQKAKAIQSAFPKTGVRTDLLSTTRRVCHSHFLRRAATEHARLGLSA